MRGSLLVFAQMFITMFLLPESLMSESDAPKPPI